MKIARVEAIVLRGPHVAAAAAGTPEPARSASIPTPGSAAGAKSIRARKR
jgi:hypothetical protein